MSVNLPALLERHRVGSPPVEPHPVEPHPAELQPVEPHPAELQPIESQQTAILEVAAPEVATPEIEASEGTTPELAVHVPARAAVGRTIARVVLLALVVGWALLLSPQAIGGPVFYGRTLTSAMTPSIAKGEIVVAERQAGYRLGDVIVYRDSHAGRAGTMIVGRVVGGGAATGYVVKGDRSLRPDRFHPTSAQVLGRVRLHVSLLAFLTASVVAAAMVFLLVVAAWPRRRLRR